ncbi:MAG: peptide deformylase [Proteobacteria bacterium]|nr:peptide deformylase [Pseudomonadota bacterium]
MQDMAKILPIVLQPHASLSGLAEPAAGATEEILRLLEDMQSTLYAADGVGLAAPQLNIRQRLVVIDVGVETDDGRRDLSQRHPRFMINPEITWRSEDLVSRQEGCLSLPGLWGQVERPARVKVAYTNRDGQHVEEELGGLLSACAQHEIDHLDGVLFPQRTSKVRQEMLMKKWKKIRTEVVKYGASFPTLAAEKGVIPPGTWSE